MNETQWIVMEIDGRIASVAADYLHASEIMARLASHSPSEVAEIRTRKVPTSALPELDASVKWEDLQLYGTAFQKKVWETLYGLTHPAPERPKLLSYSDFAALCGTPQGVRATAHALALNPVAYIIPCHLVIPKESSDRIAQIREGAENTLFRGSDLYLLDTIDVGEFEYGPDLKRELIKLQFAKV